MSQKSLAKEKRIRTALSIILTVICIIYMLPIVTLIINTFKGSTYVKSETFALPSSESFVGVDNYVKGMTFGNYDFWKTVLYSFTITILSSAMILLFTSMAAWFGSSPGWIPRSAGSSTTCACSPWWCPSRWSCSPSARPRIP